MIQQTVTAVGGFAYGVINADLHVFSNGAPLYLLAGWAPSAPYPERWLLQMPSRMLNARREVVPFTGREAELAELRDWRDSPDRLAARWLHGPGGQGKTRLAARFANECEAAGWRVATALHGPDADPPAPGSHDLTLDGYAGLLLIVDYADRWLLSNLTWLLKNALLHRDGVPTRVLLIGRTLDAWPAVSAILDTHLAGTSHQRLPDLAAGPDRRDMFAAARDGFAALYQLDPARIAPISDLDGLTLAVHMAALVAVDAAAEGRIAPQGTDALTRYLLNREQLGWDRTVTTPRDPLARAVFVAALTGAMPGPDGVALLTRLDAAPDPSRVLADHAICYPPEHAGAVLEPLYPDRLAEDFLALTIPGHESDYPAKDWATAYAIALLAPESPHLARTVTFLGAAASRWPHVGRSFLYRHLTEHPDVAVAAGGTALAALTTPAHVDRALLEAVEPLLPATPHVDLDVAGAVITSHLTRHRLAEHAGTPAEAGIQLVHSLRMGNAGRRSEALAAAARSLEVQRQASSGRPEEILGVAVTLMMSGARLTESGRPDEGILQLEEAVQILLTHGESNMGAAGLLLLEAMNNLGCAYVRAGRYADAVDTLTDVIEALRSEMPPDAPAALSSALPDALANLAAALQSLGRAPQALEAATEAVDRLRPLAESEPDAYGPTLGRTLYNLASIQDDLGQTRQAHATAVEALELSRRHSDVNPDAHRPQFASELGNLTVYQAKLGGQSGSAEVLEAFRDLAATDPDAYRPELAITLHNRSRERYLDGDLQGAKEDLQEAIWIYFELTESHPGRYGPGLLAALSAMAVYIDAMGHPKEALGIAERGVDTGRHLAKATGPGPIDPTLAHVLENLSGMYEKAGRIREAMRAAEEAVAVHGQMYERNPGAESAYITALQRIGRLYRVRGRHQAAAAEFEQAVRQYRSGPAGMVTVIDALGRLYSATKRRAEAVATLQHVVRIARGTGDLELLAHTLQGYSVCLAQARRTKEAVEPAELAVALYRQLDLNADLVVALRSLGNIQLANRQWRLGVRTIGEASAVERRSRF
ncbi:tetratricopeptide repeat protein [Actinoplanes aureus]|uniref:Tetratricopeptide repeat protein n=1 Tax=Actinoplanes aureus TaxID=2792083 RepID=A0A931CFJ4_9ACTN|nr:tetratricopeptide repeat protein [Actinoplanes aureus]MBG0567077.1 tetratricopeptide repeat protein [Actinoplanes aureus]